MVTGAECVGCGQPGKTRGLATLRPDGVDLQQESVYCDCCWNQICGAFDGLAVQALNAGKVSDA